MNKAATELPNDVEALKALIVSQQIELARLQEQLNLLLHKRYGASSEKHNPDQIFLFDEDVLTAQPEQEAQDASVPVSGHQRRRGKRAPLPEFIPRVDVIHDLPEAEKQCPHDGHALTRIGEECSEQLDVIPAKIQVIRHIRVKYACPCCDQSIKTAPLPPQPIPKSQASPGLLAHIAVGKYVDALPLYRQSEMWSRVNVQLDRTTLANWMVKVGELLTPIINLMQDTLLASPLVQCDETHVQVLKEPGKVAQAKSYMWVRTSGVPPNRIILFNYAPSRSGEVPKELLQGFEGKTLLTDGYDGYNAVVREQSLIHAGCWSHARRKFDEALRGRKKSKQQPKGGKASYAINTIGKLYQVERAAKGMDTQTRRHYRQEHALPILAELRQWLDDSLNQVPPKSLTGTALHYLSNEWNKLIVYTEDGRVPIDNNVTENVIRPFVIGRKNWLFSNSQSGAKSSAAIYSVIQTAKANGLEPYDYLRRVLTELPKVESLGQIEALLPLADQNIQG